MHHEHPTHESMNFNVSFTVIKGFEIHNVLYSIIFDEITKDI